MRDSERACIREKLAAAVRDKLLLKAGAALQKNDISVAERLLKARLYETPFDVVAIRMLAETAARIGRYEDAEKLLRRALELEPAFDEARLNYATILLRRGKFAEASDEVERVLQFAPNDPHALTIKAAVCARSGSHEEAIAVYGKVLSACPDQPQLWMSLGHVFKAVGRRSECIAAYRRAIAGNSTLGEAWWSLANLKTAQFAAVDIAAMQRALADTTSPVDRYHLHFALGKAYEDAGDYGTSFQHYDDGNRLRRADLSYEADETTRHVTRSQRLLTRDAFAQRAGWGLPSPDPIFIVSLPRAGSTLLEQILSSHSLIEGTRELSDIMALSSDLADSAADDYFDRLLQLDPASLQALGRAYLERTRVHRRTDRPFFIDKMPNNFLHVGFIHLILPNAKIIDARRHPLGTCFSCYKQHFSRGQPFTYNLQELGRYYRDYLALMEHYDSVLPDRVYRVCYEKLVANPEEEIKSLLAYCGLEFEPACLEFHSNQRAVHTASSEQVRQPISADAVDQWRRFERWLGPLQRALEGVVDSPGERTGVQHA